MSSRANETTRATGLGELFSLANESVLWTDTDYGALLSHQLRMPIPGTEGVTFQDSLLNPNPNPEHLRLIKEVAKSARDNKASGIPKNVCHVLYYAAIAAAYVHGVKLSSLPPKELSRGLTWAVGLSWLPEPLKGLFSRAQDRLADHVSDD